MVPIYRTFYLSQSNRYNHLRDSFVFIFIIYFLGGLFFLFWVGGVVGCSLCVISQTNKNHMLNRNFQWRKRNFVNLTVRSTNILQTFSKPIHRQDKYTIKTSLALQTTDIQIVQTKQNIYIVLQNKKLSKIADAEKPRQHS